MAVDPEGRFLLFQDHQYGTLFRIRLDQSQPGVPEVLFTTAEIPELAETVWINPGERVSSGDRFWVLIEPDTDAKQKGKTARVLLWDPDNDGLFDSHQTVLFNDYLPLFLPTPANPTNPCRFPWKYP